jgi:hypothetical protein
MYVGAFDTCGSTSTALSKYNIDMPYTEEEEVWLNQLYDQYDEAFRLA